MAIRDAGSAGPMPYSKLVSALEHHAAITTRPSAAETPSRWYLSAMSNSLPMPPPGFDALPVDEDDVYTKYEASGPDWFQIEH